MADIELKQTLKVVEKFQQQNLVSPKELFKINSSYDPVEVVRLINELKVQTPLVTTSKAKGDLLENLVKYLIKNCGFLVEDEHGQKNRQQELDHCAELSLHLYEFLKGKGINRFSFLGESKNYPNDPIDVNIVYKVEALKVFIEAGIGAYFCRKGLTGDELLAAHTLVKDFHNRFHNCSIVFTDEDWDFLLENPLKFGELFYEKLKRFLSMYDWKIDLGKV